MRKEKLIFIQSEDPLLYRENDEDFTPRYYEKVKESKRTYSNAYVLSENEDKMFYWIGKIFFYSLQVVGLIALAIYASNTI